MRLESAVPSATESATESSPEATLTMEASYRARFFDFAFLTAIYGVVLWFGQRRDLWYDELFTWHIARLPRVLDIWNALRDGVDLNPPLSYLLVRASQSVFGGGNFGTRLPSMLAFIVAGWCLYAFMSRRNSRVVAFFTALLPLASKVFLYGFEARPYALLVMCGAASMYLWQRATDRKSSTRSRKIARCGLALSLAIAVSSHYFGVFLLWPLLVGEAVRHYCGRDGTRNCDRNLLMALLMGVAPLVVFVPLLRNARQYANGFWAQPELVADTMSFYEQLAEMMCLMAFVLVAVWLVVGRMQLAAPARKMRQREWSLHEWSLHEWACVAALATLPVVCVTAAWLSGSGYVFRYAVPGVIGVVLLVGIIAGALEKRWPPVRWLYAAMCAASVFVTQITMSPPRAANATSPQRVLEDVLSASGLRSLPSETPIVVSEPQRFLQLYHYAPRALQQRLVYLSDASLSLRYLKNDTADRALTRLASGANLPVRDYRRFRQKNRRFFLLDGTADKTWLTPDLSASGTRFQTVAQSEGIRLSRVEVWSEF